MVEGSAPWRERKNLKEEWQKGKSDGKEKEKERDGKGRKVQQRGESHVQREEFVF